MSREEQMRDFLAAHGWGDAAVTPIPGDASTRRYFRLADASRKALLMDQPQGAEAPTAPPNAGAEQRRALGYNAVARLAGADVGRFAEVAQYLKDRGLSAPDIHAVDTAHGFMVIEDLGDGYRLQFGKAVAEIMPAHAGKGPIIAFLMRHQPFSGRIPIFVGDDLTDESGFEAVTGLGGIAVKVGEGPTSARFRVRSPAELKAWLREAANGRIDPIGLPAA